MCLESWGIANKDIKGEDIQKSKEVKIINIIKNLIII
jgi:hypothetical protein